MTLSTRTFKILMAVGLFFFSLHTIAGTAYLAKPTGPYRVGFKEFRWINKSICPDFNYSGKNQSDFSPTNKKHCHEMSLRIYYPSTTLPKHNSPYDRFTVNMSLQQIKDEKTPISPKDIQSLKDIKSHAIQNAPFVSHKTFPVILFASGNGNTPQSYENIITNLVSNGYIVVGVNTSFVNPTLFKNGHVVQSGLTGGSDTKLPDYVKLGTANLIYTYKKLHKLHDQLPSSIFSRMNLKKIGVLGHSFGALTVANISHEHPNWFQAGASLDLGTCAYDACVQRNKFEIPFMHIIASTNKVANPIPFKLGKNNYLVGVAPNRDHSAYSTHASFSDLSTLQYHPAMRALSRQDNKRLFEAFSFRLFSHEPTPNDIKTFGNMTMVLVKRDNGQWLLSLYGKAGKHYERAPINISSFHKLINDLNNLPPKAVSKLTKAELAHIKNDIKSIYRILLTEIGAGNGRDITSSINTYLLQFFDTYLKQKPSPDLNHCRKLKKNTYMVCGPGEA